MLEAVGYAADIITITRERLLALDTQPQPQPQQEQESAYLNGLTASNLPLSFYGTDSEQQRLGGSLGGGGGVGFLGGGVGFLGGGGGALNGGWSLGGVGGSFGGDVSEAFERQLLQHGGLSEAVGMTDLRQALRAVREVVEWIVNNRLVSHPPPVHPPPSTVLPILSTGVSLVPSEYLTLPHHHRQQQQPQQQQHRQHRQLEGSKSASLGNTHHYDEEEEQEEVEEEKGEVEQLRRTVASLRAEIASYSYRQTIATTIVASSSGSSSCSSDSTLLTSDRHLTQPSDQPPSDQPPSVQRKENQRVSQYQTGGLTGNLNGNLNGDLTGNLTGDLTDEIDALRGKLRRADKHYVVMCRTIEQLEGEIKTQVPPSPPPACPFCHS